MSKPAQRPPFAATRKALAEALAEIDGLLPGSVVVRLMRCGKPNCACKADPPALHGPYTQWTRTVAGKTVTKLLTDEQLARYQPWFDNSRRLKDLIAKLEIVSLQAIETADRLTATTDTPAPRQAGNAAKPRHSPEPVRNPHPPACDSTRLHHR